MKNEGFPTVADMDQRSGKNQAKSEQPYIGYRIVGLISIFFGIIVGLVLLISLLSQAESGSSILGLGRRKLDGTQMFFMFAVSLGVSLLFITPGVICVGVYNILESIAQGTNTEQQTDTEQNKITENPAQYSQKSDESVPFQYLIASGEVEAQMPENDDENKKEPT